MLSLLALSALPLLTSAEIDCGGGASCPTSNTCCRNGEGGFSCCPVKDATCCGDYVHCCPPEHPVCNINTGSCTSLNSANSASLAISVVPWMTKQLAKVHQPANNTKVQPVNGNFTAIAKDGTDCSNDKCLFLVTNPTSPSGKQHCQELDNPNGNTGKYWASKGWKYTSPPWTLGKCDRNLFNFVNREIQDLDGFEGVIFWELGIQV